MWYYKDGIKISEAYMKRTVAFILLAVVMLTSVSCSDRGWKGFYEEDLGKYLTLADYEKFTYTAPSIEVTDGEVDERISIMLEASAIMTETDKALGDGMTVTFDRYCFIDGVARPELSVEDGTFALDGGEYEDEAVSKLLPLLKGMKKGDTATLEIKLSSSYTGAESEKTAEYTVTVRAVYEKNVPKLTDSVAPTLISGCNTVAELKAEVRLRLLKDKQSEAERKTVSEMRKKLIDLSALKSVPYSLYNEYYEDRMFLYERLAEAASMTLEEYLAECTDMTVDELKDLLSKMATADVKEIIVLYSVVKKENITHSDKQITEYAEKMANDSEGVFASGEEYLSYYGKNAVTTEYLWSVVMDTVLAKATVSD